MYICNVFTVYDNVADFMITSINIEGKEVTLSAMSKSQLGGVWLEAMWTFRFYEAFFMEYELVVLEQKKDKKCTPMQLEQFANRLQGHFGKTIVFLLDPMPAYLRQRLAERGVYFIISGKYAFLPFLYANRKVADKTPAKQLTPSAQYLLLWHLQEKSIEGQTARTLDQTVPLPYLTISRAIMTMEELGLCECRREGKMKVVHFSHSGKDLWEKILPFMLSPVKKVLYCDLFKGSAITGGINALSHYTHINPEEQTTIVVTQAQMKQLQVEGLNPVEGAVRIEVWKYAPIAENGYVDKLSLALSLRDDNDERVLKEVEQMIDSVWFTE